MPLAHLQRRCLENSEEAGAHQVILLSLCSLNLCSVPGMQVFRFCKSLLLLCDYCPRSTHQTLSCNEQA